ncbi:MAG: type II secretion system protein [Phycisphaeraceae bacterium]|nr:type II secretion system protein [Phycisphaeraceae bacterium]
MSLRDSSSMRKAGFSLIELLVCLGIVSILLSLVIPALSKARLSATEIVCRSHMSSIGQHFLMYALDFDDAPIAIVPDSHEVSRDPSRWLEYSIQMADSLYSQAWQETTGLSPPFADVLYCPANQFPPESRSIDYWLSEAWYADARYLDPSLPESDWSRRLGARVQRIASVRFPSLKAGAREIEVWHGWGGSAHSTGGLVDYKDLALYTSPRPGAVWFVDGHVRLMHARDATPVVYRYPNWPYIPFGTTPWGVEGRDRE